MAYDTVRICNLALSHSGSQQFITSLDQGTTESELCLLHYEPARDAVLRDLQWPFAMRFAALALVETADGTQDWSDEWAYAYRYPANCSRIRRLLTGIRTSDQPFVLGSDVAGKLVFCDVTDARIAYTHLVTDVTIYPPEFCEAVAWKMAAKMAFALSGRPDLRAQAEQQYDRILGEAKTSSLTEQRLDPAPDADSTRARE